MFSSEEYPVEETQIDNFNSADFREMRNVLEQFLPMLRNEKILEYWKRKRQTDAECNIPAKCPAGFHPGKR